MLRPSAFQSESSSSPASFVASLHSPPRFFHYSALPAICRQPECRRFFTRLVRRRHAFSEEVFHAASHHFRNTFHACLSFPRQVRIANSENGRNLTQQLAVFRALRRSVRRQEEMYATMAEQPFRQAYGRRLFSKHVAHSSESNNARCVPHKDRPFRDTTVRHRHTDPDAPPRDVDEAIDCRSVVSL